jgi:hypothetical protein
MSTLLDQLRRRLVIFGQRPHTFAPAGDVAPSPVEDWQAARPSRIRRALERALARPTGNWYVLDETRALGESPTRHVIDGFELVAWRDHGAVRVAPNACPHMGASLADGCARRGRLVCPWHGLELGAEGHGAWQTVPTHDDGVLTWVRLGPAVPAVPLPVLAPRPSRYIAAVMKMDLRCAPADVIQNRLDPWHGTHLHNASFASLAVLGNDEDVLRLRVAFRVWKSLCVETDCTFHSPEPNTIVMTVVDGEGAGSVVETHATPMEPGVTRLVEATLAASPRPGFRRVLPFAALLRPLIKRAAMKLWDDDGPYAERLQWLRDHELARDAGQLERVAARGTPQK